MSKPALHWPAAGALLCLSVSLSIHAEEPAELDDLLVTAALEPLSVRDVAASVTVITREEIEQRQARYLVDLLRDVPGFSVSQSGGPGAQSQVRVRGAEANQLLVLIDGVRANDPASSDEFQWPYALASNIERIEIVRGPQSAVWGADAMAGVVNIILREDARESWLGGHLEGGSFDSVDAAFDGGWSSSGVRLRAGVAHADTDGINIARTGGERDGTRNTTLDAALDWRASEDWRVALSGRHVSAENAFDATDFAVTGLPVDGDLATETDRSTAHAEARFEPGGRYSGEASVNWSDTDNRNFTAGIEDSSTAASVLDLRLRGSAYLGGRDTGQEHRVTAGLDRIRTDFSQRGIATPFGDPNQDQDFDQTGVALEYVGRPFEDLTWTLGGRYDDFSDFESIATWRVAASHRLDERWRLRGSYATAFKTPTFTERYGFYPDQFVGNPDLEPERSRGWELGLEYTGLSDRVRVGFAYFDQDLEDEIDGFVFDPETFLFTAQNRETPSDRTGFELELDADPVRDLSIAFNYTYTDATETDPVTGPFREVRRPRHSASLNANWRFAGGRGSLNLNVNYAGEQDDRFFNPATFLTDTVVLDAYTVADVAGAWKLSDSLELIARVTNLTDEDYEEVLGYSRPGRAYYAGLRFTRAR